MFWGVGSLADLEGHVAEWGGGQGALTVDHAESRPHGGSRTACQTQHLKMLRNKVLKTASPKEPRALEVL